MRTIFLPLILTAALPLLPAQDSLAVQAERDLFSARYSPAADEYARLALQDPKSAFTHDRLVRSLLAAHQPERAFAAAEDAARLAPGTAPTLTALGRVAFRKGDLAGAEKLFRQAVAADPKYPDALVGLAIINYVVSHFQAAHRILTVASRLNPLDPDTMMPLRNPAEAVDDEQALHRALDSLDPASEEALRLRAHIARTAALQGRRCKLISPFDSTQLKLIRLLDPEHNRGLGLDARVNGKVFHLLLDTGASGIALSPAAAKRAQLEILGNVSTPAKGFGDKVAGAGFTYLAAQLRIGTLQWEHFPVHVFRGARDSDIDGLIGTDVFYRFLVIIDFPGLRLSLEPRIPEPTPGAPPEERPRPTGFTAFLRFGHMLLIPTSLNGGRSKLFLLDSGSMMNLVDIRAAQDSTSVRHDSSVRLRGVQGEVKDVRSAGQGTLVFAGFRQQNPGLTAVDLSRLNEDVGTEISGVIGMPVFWHLRMTIDYASGSLKLERSPNDPG